MLYPMSAMQIESPNSRPSQACLPLARHEAGRALSGYICIELRTGRTLESILGDRGVRNAIEQRPDLLEDLCSDRELAEAVRRASVPASSTCAALEERIATW